MKMTKKEMIELYVYCFNLFEPIKNKERYKKTIKQIQQRNTNDDVKKRKFYRIKESNKMRAIWTLNKERIIKVESRQERDNMTRVLKEIGYKLIDWRYHEDIFQREDGKIARIIDIRE